MTITLAKFETFCASHVASHLLHLIQKLPLTKNVSPIRLASASHFHVSEIRAYSIRIYPEIDVKKILYNTRLFSKAFDVFCIIRPFWDLVRIVGARHTVAAITAVAASGNEDNALAG